MKKVRLLTRDGDPFREADVEGPGYHLRRVYHAGQYFEAVRVDPDGIPVYRATSDVRPLPRPVIRAAEIIDSHGSVVGTIEIPADGVVPKSIAWNERECRLWSSRDAFGRVVYLLPEPVPGEEPVDAR